MERSEEEGAEGEEEGGDIGAIDAVAGLPDASAVLPPLTMLIISNSLGSSEDLFKSALIARFLQKLLSGFGSIGTEHSNDSETALALATAAPPCSLSPSNTALSDVGEEERWNLP